jgi:hypothetical protein
VETLRASGERNRKPESIYYQQNQTGGKIMRLHTKSKKLKAIKKRALKKLTKRIEKESMAAWDFIK